MNSQTVLAALREALAQLYDDAASARRIATDAGVDVTRIELTTHAVNNWQAILSEAAKANQVVALIGVARGEYPANGALQAASVAYQRWLAEQAAVSVPPTVDGERSPLPANVREIPCPYRGLAVFEVEHAANYFGREVMVQKLLDRLKTANFVAVVGPSGSGKSSLVRAGLVTALRQGALPGSQGWDLAIVRPGEDPLRALAQPVVERLSASLSPVERLAETRKLAEHLRQGTLPIGDALAQLREQPGHPPRWLLIIDQFEETFTLCTDEALRRTFLNALLAMSETAWLSIVFTLRADFYGRILEEERFGRRVDAGLVNVLPMNESERRAAIEQPARNAGRRFEEGLVERILAAVAEEPGELPLLEFALTELWERQSADGLLTHAAYEEIGEVAGAIAKRADDLWRSFDLAHQTATRRLFTRLVRVARPDEGAEDTKRRISLQELDQATQALVLRLADARLLVTGRDANTGEVTVEVAHEALIRNWQDLQAWLNGDREFLLWRQRLRTLVDNWAGSERDEGALLRGALLSEAEAWAATRAGELSDLEQEFLNTSRAAINREEEAREAARRRELEQAQMARNRARLAAAMALLALLLAVAVGWILYRQNLALQGERLLREANALREARDVEGAIAKYQAAAVADPSLGIDVTNEISETRRYAAMQLIYEGEQLAAQGDREGARQKFEEALVLKPPSDTPVYIWIEPGEFLMGSSDQDELADDDEKQQHEVQLDEYWIMRTEVTNEQYKRCVDADACDRPFNERWHREEYAREPVTDVHWGQANDYAAWVGGRLPTEAEWEKACRGTDGRIYPWGNAEPTTELLNYYPSGLNSVAPVGSYSPSAFGLYDMVGNVWEWTSSLYYGYPYQAGDGREGPESGKLRTLRGGSFKYNDDDIRCAARLGDDPSFMYSNVGFRVAY
jgi:formylglycine-generating enzyme required for sulfatase activity